MTKQQNVATGGRKAARIFITISLLAIAIAVFVPFAEREMSDFNKQQSTPEATQARSDLSGAVSAIGTALTGGPDKQRAAHMRWNAKLHRLEPNPTPKEAKQQ